MISISKDKLVYDPTDSADSDNIGVYLKDGSGNAINSQTISSSQWLNVVSPGNHQDGSAYTAGSSYGTYVLGVNNSTNDFAPLSINSDGSLKVDATLVPTFAHAENSAHTVGDEGSFSLSYRQDTLVTDISATGDYAGLKSNNRGALWVCPTGTVADGVADTENPVKIGSYVQSGALSSTSSGNRANALSDIYRRIYVNNGSQISCLNTAVTVTTSAALLLSTNLAGRRSILVQNTGTRPIYVGSSASVTSSTGLRVQPGADLGMEIGDAVSLYAISGSGSQAIIVFETA